MPKKMRVIISVLVAVLLLTVGGTAVVMADDGSTATENETNRRGLLASVAEILNIPQEDLVNAFEQARQETREECQEMRQERQEIRQQVRQGKVEKDLNKAFEKGLITQDETNQIKEWWQEKPEALDRLSPRAHISPAIRGRHMWGGCRG